MKKKNLAVLLCAAVMVSILALAGCSNGSSGGSNQADNSTGYTLVQEGKLTVAASLDFPPFENLEGSQPVGFAVELMGLVSEEMGLEVSYLPSVKFDTIIPTIASGGKADVGVSSFTITEDRKREIDFTEPYCNSNQGIVVMKGSGYTSSDDLAGKRIGAQSGTTGYDWAAENVSSAELLAFDEMTAIFAALQAGQIDAIAVDLPVAQYYVKTAYNDAEVIEEIPTGEQYAMVVSKDNPELTEALNNALDSLEANGKYDELYQKWFG